MNTISNIHSGHYSCKQFDCLFHPAANAKNGCDYCIITGELRGCPAGKNCKRYLKVSEKAKRKLQLLRIETDCESISINPKYWQNL